MGWHIECSAMSQKYLTNPSTFMAAVLIGFRTTKTKLPSTCAHGPDTFARTWMHNGYLMVEGEKMSKSLGNFITVHDLLNDYCGETIRLCMLMTHYRQPLNWTTAGLAQAKDALDKWYGAIRSAGHKPTARSRATRPARLPTILTPRLRSPCCMRWQRT